MGSFTKKYSRAFHPEDELTLSWDAGYKNVTLYDGQREVYSWEKSREFIQGVTIQDVELGKIQLRFTDSKPIQLDLRVNGKKYKPTKGGKQVVDLSGQMSVFWALMTFTLIVLFISIAAFRSNLLSPEAIIINGYLIVVSIVYFLTAFLMMKQYHGAFFVGYSYTALHMVFLLLGVINALDAGFFFMTFLFFAIRVAIFVYLTLSIRKVVYAIKTKKTPNPTNLIDDKF